MQNNIKIALLTNGIFPFIIGGMQKHSYFLAKYFAKNQLYVDVFHPGGKIKKEINISDFFTKEELRYLAFIEIPFPKIKTFPGHYILSSYLYSKALYNHLALCKEENKFIYAQGFTSWYFLKKQNFQQNLISNLHGLEMFQCTINLKNRLEQILLKIPASFIIKKSNKQISLGGKLTNILYKNGGKPNLVVEIPNAIESNWVINESAFKSENSTQRIKFVFIGRYERRKGIEEFHEVIQKTIDILNYEVNFIGPIPEEKQFKHKNVNYLGAIMESDKIKEVLINSDILVCPSYSEGMPTVILEAMACGCAIICTDVGANSTMVSEDNGWLIYGGIEKGLEKYLTGAVKLSKKELSKMKINSICKVKEEFTWGKVMIKMIKELEI